MPEAKPMSALRCRMIDDMTLCNLSPATQRSYLHAVTKFSRHFGYPDHPGAAGPQQSVDDGALHPCGNFDDRQDAKPNGSPRPNCHAARLSGAYAPRSGSGGYLSPPRPCLSPGSAGFARPRRDARHARH